MPSEHTRRLVQDAWGLEKLENRVNVLKLRIATATASNSNQQQQPAASSQHVSCILSVHSNEFSLKRFTTLSLTWGKERGGESQEEEEEEDDEEEEEDEDPGKRVSS
ncbi:hypothetical protein M0802_013791 [Mischocyttarus mexicanus]|nr:hypothetical protein M0802_013791 [Mischocyttarus mexicanus]